MRLTLARLKWVTVIAPILFIGLLELIRRALGDAFISSWAGYLLLGGMLLLGALLFSEAVFRYVEHLQEQLRHQNSELLALHEAGLDISGELELEKVLQRIVDRARQLVGARYGALSVLGVDGEVEYFVTSGITPEERERIGPPPRGHGLLGIVLEEGRSLRLRDLTQHPRSVGFPPNHPPMRSLLAVPIEARGRILGSLYLTEKEGAQEFTEEDERILSRFATQAALAIENARLHRQVLELAISQERARIAREMHDGLAQVLGYVNLKTQAVRTLLGAGQLERVEQELERMEQAAREAYTDLRENILALRTSPDAQRGFLETLRAYVEQWEDQSNIRAELEVHVSEEGLGLPSGADLQLLRIVQEALANVRKHSGASRVRVTLREQDGWLEVSVEDNGVGFDPGSPSRGDFPKFGLSTMRERAESIGGKLEIEAAQGRGTRVVARVPLRSRVTARR